MQRHDHNATDAPAPAGQYTQAIEVSGNARTLYISGQVGIAADGTVPDDAGMQAKLAWQNLQAQLRAAGMTIENLVRPPRLCPMRLTLPLYGRVARQCSARTNPPAH